MKEQEVFVPLNDKDCVIDLIQPDYKVIVVSRHYLGSINHTLLTIEALKSRNISIAGIIFLEMKIKQQKYYFIKI